MIKESFREKREQVETSWRQGCCGRELIAKLSSAVDELIQESFASVADDQGVVVIALGGYGRSELYPYSDVDLFLLYENGLERDAQAVADAILYPLWDVGLEVGHGVRSFSEALFFAKEDYPFQVALLDARVICGDSGLWQRFKAQCMALLLDGGRKAFVQEMRERRQLRCHRFGSHSYMLEPHIKEGKGGMRDIQAMLWTAQVVFGLRGVEALASAGMLLPDEKESFLLSWDLLVRLRVGLHFLSGRRNDQLYFEQQLELAEAFGYSGEEKILPVEAFMRDLYGHLQNIALVTDLFFDHIDETLGLDAAQASIQDKVVEKGIEVRRGKVHLTATSGDITRKPHIVIRLFLVMARTGLPLHYRSRKQVSAALAVVTDKVRRSPRMVKPFLAILLEAKDLFTVLEVMFETGLLTAFIPEFSQVESLAQHDMYHIYTVDRHLLQTVVELRSLLQKKELGSEDVQDPTLLYCAALFHDLGKGLGCDHSEAGAARVAAIASRFGFSDAQVEEMSFLVRYHLFIPESALRRDLNDAAFIQRCAGRILSHSRLAMLYLLSIADSRATGPSAWSEWKGSLMHEMYLKVHAALAHDVEEVVEEQEEQGVDWLRAQLAAELERCSFSFDLAVLPADYLLAFAVPEIVAHLELCQKHQRLLRQKALLQESEVEGEWKVLLMSHDRPGVLAKLCGVLALHGLSVASAQIFTWRDGVVVDEVVVRSLSRGELTDASWDAIRADFDMVLAHRLDIGLRLYQKKQGLYQQQSVVADSIASRVLVDNASSDRYSVLELYAADRPHLLYHITQTLADFGISIYKAYIATEVEQLIDVFYVLDAEGNKIVPGTFRDEVIRVLLGVLNKK